jgi:colanic acid/amylovoran biosynthesis glycosyltransferase
MKLFDIVAIREYFPSVENPSVSTWVFNKAKEIQKYNLVPLVISPTPNVPWALKLLMKRKHAWKTKPAKKIENYKGVQVIRPPFLKLPNKIFLEYNLRSISKCILKTSENFEFRIIHAHFGHAGISSIPLKYKKSIPLITSFYGFDLGADKEKLQKHYKRLAETGDLFLALSEDMAQDLIALGFPENKIIVHHLGVDINNFDFSPKNQDDQFVFTVVASFEERKGIQYTIRAFIAFLEDKDPARFQLRLVGDGPFFKDLKYLTKGFTNIIFINNFKTDNPRGTVLAEIKNCDAFILTSITTSTGEKEGTPVVLMEAQSCGKPCIATRHAGIPEQVLDGVTGILVEERNINQITAAMNLLCNEHDLRIKMGIEARKHIEINFNNQKQIRILNDIYKKLL